MNYLTRIVLLYLCVKCVSCSFVQQRCFPFADTDVDYYNPPGELTVTAKENTSLLIYPLCVIHGSNIPRVIDEKAIGPSEDGFFLCTDELVSKGICGGDEAGKFQYNCTEKSCDKNVAQHILSVDKEPQSVSYRVLAAGVHCVVSVQARDTTADAITVEQHHNRWGRELATMSNSLDVLEGAIHIYPWSAPVSWFFSLCPRGLIPIETCGGNFPRSGTPFDLPLFPAASGLVAITNHFLFICFILIPRERLIAVFFEASIWILSSIYMLIGKQVPDSYQPDPYMLFRVVRFNTVWWVFWGSYCISWMIRWPLLPLLPGLMTLQTYRTAENLCDALISALWISVWGLNWFMVRKGMARCIPECTGDRLKYRYALRVVIGVVLGLPFVSLLAQMIHQVPLWWKGGGFYIYLVETLPFWNIIFPSEGPFERPVHQALKFQCFKHLPSVIPNAVVVGLSILICTHPRFGDEDIRARIDRDFKPYSNCKACWTYLDEFYDVDSD